MFNIEYEPENEKSKDMDYNIGKSELELGYVKDENDFYSPGPTERRDEYGNVVSHQDSTSYPSRKGLV